MNASKFRNWEPLQDDAEQEQDPQIQRLMQGMTQLTHQEIEKDAQLARIELKLDEVLHLLRQARHQ